MLLQQTPTPCWHGEKVIRVSVSTASSARSTRRVRSAVPSLSSSSSLSTSSSGSSNGRRLSDKFKGGDVLLLTPRYPFRGNDFPPREGLVMDVREDYLTLGVSNTWPMGLVEMRKHVNGYIVRTDRVSSTVPLRAWRMALDQLGKDVGGTPRSCWPTFTTMITAARRHPRLRRP